MTILFAIGVGLVSLAVGNFIGAACFNSSCHEGPAEGWSMVGGLLVLIAGVFMLGLGIGRM